MMSYTREATKKLHKFDTHTHKYIHVFIHKDLYNITTIITFHTISNQVSDPSSHTHHRPQCCRWSRQSWSYYRNTSYNWECLVKTCNTNHELRYLLQKLLSESSEDWETVRFSHYMDNSMSYSFVSKFLLITRLIVFLDHPLPLTELSRNKTIWYTTRWMRMMQNKSSTTEQIPERH